MSSSSVYQNTLNSTSEFRLLRLPAREDKEDVNQQLYQLVQFTNMEMDYDLFSVIVDLLRAGVDPEALFVFLSKFYKSTKYYKKFVAMIKANKARRKSEMVVKNGSELNTTYMVKKEKETESQERERGPE